MLAALLLVAPLLLLPSSAADRADPPTQAARTDPYSDPQAVVFRGRLQVLTRTETPNIRYEGDDVIVSNSCGYDTAVFEVRDVMLGTRVPRELSAHLHLGEFCDSILQTEVKDYLVHVVRSGEYWEMTRELSSPLLRARGGSMWLVEPAMLEYLATHLRVTAQTVHFREEELGEIAVGRLARRGILPEPGTPMGAWIAELKSTTRGPSSPGNPLYYDRGIDLETFRKAIGAARTRNAGRPRGEFARSPARV
jgi:hypothetical protein